MDITAGDGISEAMNQLPGVSRLLQEGMDLGLHPGAQVYVSLNNEVKADFSLGYSRLGILMQPNRLMSWLSATKPILAVSLGQLWEEGLIDLDKYVAYYIPSFAVHGKEEITIRHVLTHTAGFRSVVDLDWNIGTWHEVIERICASRLEPKWVPGKKAGYQAASGWFILGEVIRLLVGHPFAEHVRKTILLPIGMEDSWIGMSVERFREYGEQLALLYNTTKDEPRIQEEGAAEAIATRANPGIGGRGPMRDLGRFYEMLLHEGQAATTKVLQPQTVAMLTGRHRVGLFDQTFRHVMDWGLGFVLNSRLNGVEVPYCYGQHASLRAFGHSGRQSTVGFADPEYGLVAAIAVNGMPGEARHRQRFDAILTQLYEDLELG